MEGATTLLTFGQQNFGTAQLGNRTRTKRLVQLADQILQHPGGTLPDKLSRPADLRALYRMVNRPAVTHAAVFQGHRDLTLEKMRQTAETVLIIHDATELDYSGLTSVRDDLGQIGNGHRRGYLCHNSVALIPSTREVLGLANQILHRRPVVAKNETREHKRRRQSRESRLWTKGSEAIGPAPEGRLWVDVCDRGADVFEYIDHKHASGGHYVVRAHHDRSIQVLEDNQPQRRSLFGYARGLAEWDRKVIDVPARPAEPGKAAQPARTATVRISAGPLHLLPPRQKRGEHRDEPLAVWVVAVLEIDPPPGVDAVHWILLTNVAVRITKDAWERVEWYQCRWTVEELHKAQKTGCGIEEMQFTTVGAMEPAIALLSVVAVFLLQLRCASRQADVKERPATELMPAEYVSVLSGWRYGEPGREMTIEEFFYALARLGGHQNRKADGLPGWLVLWRGWTKLHAMVEGAEIMRYPKHGQT